MVNSGEVILLILVPRSANISKLIEIPQERLRSDSLKSVMAVYLFRKRVADFIADFKEWTLKSICMFPKRMRQVKCTIRGRTTIMSWRGLLLASGWVNFRMSILRPFSKACMQLTLVWRTPHWLGRENRMSPMRKSCCQLPWQTGARQMGSLKKEG